jgi:HSP20 family protein
MNPFERIGRGLFDTWESLAAGWHELWQRAGNALTRFHPTPQPDDSDEQSRVRREASQWGILAAEVSTGGDSIDVMLEVPGMEPEDFDIEVSDGHLIVRGEKRIERERRDGRYVLTERAYGRFERRVALPEPVDNGAANASYKRGVLRITLPKLTRSAPKRGIKVTSE